MKKFNATKLIKQSIEFKLQDTVREFAFAGTRTKIVNYNVNKTGSPYNDYSYDTFIRFKLKVFKNVFNVIHVTVLDYDFKIRVKDKYNRQVGCTFDNQEIINYITNHYNK